MEMQHHVCYLFALFLFAHHGRHALLAWLCYLLTLVIPLISRQIFSTNSWCQKTTAEAPMRNRFFFSFLPSPRVENSFLDCDKPICCFTFAHNIDLEINLTFVGAAPQSHAGLWDWHCRPAPFCPLCLCWTYWRAKMEQEEWGALNSTSRFILVIWLHC
jgi:hypothetical protein